MYIHELLHVSLEDCILLEHPLDKKDDMEEGIVRFISPKLWDYLKNNKKLREFILE